jgi:hypothetical protein
MAEQKYGLSSDASKVNPYGAPQEQLSEYQKSLEEQINALEQRYQQPNWFKVSAGFLKPQLGGFAASLGSASDAIGENLERQREAQLPIAQMRAQLAQSNILTGQNKTQSDEFAQWQASGKPMDQKTYARIFGLNPNSSVAAAAKAAYEGGSKDIENTRSQQRAILDAITLKQAKALPLTASEKNFLETFASGLIGSTEAARASSMAAPGAPGTPPAAQPASSQAAPEAEAQPAKKAEEKFTPYPATFAFPDLSNMSDPQREATQTAYKRNAESAESKSEAQVQQWRSLAADPVYSAVDSEYKSAINLLKSDPETSKKVFNLLRGPGGVINQVMSAAQAGVGVSLGNMAATLNIPVEAFQRAGLNEEQQMVADRLVRAMLVVGNAKLAAQGISPEKGKEFFQQYLDSTKASLQQNAATALHNLEKDYLSFQQTKKLHDQVLKEHRLQQQYSVTPYTDVINSSPEIQRINKEARERMMQQEALYAQAVKSRNESRKQNKER